MRRRNFISLLGGAAAWPLTVRGEQSKSVRRVGVLMTYAEDDPQAQGWIAAFKHALGEAGWIADRNLRIDYRWAGGELERINQFANEIVALKPEVLLSTTTPATAAFKRETSAIPIIFVVVSDPVGEGFVESLPRPGGNITGFLNLEGSVGSKWLGLLKDVAPSLKRAGIMFNPETAPEAGQYFLPSFEEAGRKLGVTTNPAPVHSPAEIERAIADLAAGRSSGLVAQSDAFLVVHLKQVIALAEAYKLPVVYGLSQGARQGGLLSYTTDILDMFGRSAGYVDRILKGEKPAALPVQAPTKYELVINLKTAKALGLNVPPTLLAIADEVIE
jgi:putative ABC transport system substrate-binding protein